MILRTESYRDLEEDIASIFNCKETNIFDIISDFHKQCIDGFNSDWDKFNDLIEQFVESKANLSLVDEVYIYHLARHLRKPVELLPLKELLLSKNMFSDFLAKNKVEFKNCEGHLAFYYKDKLITPSLLLEKKHQGLLARRIGYLGEEDFCINGFTFWPDIEETSDGYYRDLQFGPEFLGCIERYLGIDLCGKFRENSKYYGVVFRVPIKDVIFDGVDNVKTQREKVIYLISYSLRTLHGCYFQQPFSSNNPILRVRDDYRAKVDHCILITE
ncbi:MAG: hypothetical protein PHY47_12425 [Lachnospiraceae bacterium]|nr:hypothetical protein [Lachnospiraceae bacterium]